ncbi:hypothetical protein Tco_0934615 [Tanacetum coccineum]
MLYGALKEMLPSMVNKETQADVAVMIAKAIQKECENLCAEVISQVNDAIDLQHQLYLMMKDDEQLRNADLPIWLSLKIKFKKITTATSCRPSAIHARDHDHYQDDDSRLKGENSAKRQKMLEYGT